MNDNWRINTKTTIEPVEDDDSSDDMKKIYKDDDDESHDSQATEECDPVYCDSPEPGNDILTWY